MPRQDVVSLDEIEALIGQPVGQSMTRPTTRQGPSLADLLASGDIMSEAAPEGVRSSEVLSQGYHTPTGERFTVPKQRQQPVTEPINFGQLMQLLQHSRGLDPQAQFGILSRFIPGLQAPPSEFAKAEKLATMRAHVNRTEAAQAYLDAPASKSELENFVDKETLSPFPFGTTRAQLKGAVNVSPKQRRLLTEMDESRALLNEVTGITDRLITAENAPQGVARGTKLLAQSYLPGTLAKIYGDKKPAFLGVLSRTLGAEKGVLTDRDITRISNAMPSFYETVESKNFKNRTLDLILDAATDARHRAIFGGKPAVNRARLDALLDQLESSQLNIGRTGRADVGTRRQLASGKWAVKTASGWESED